MRLTEGDSKALGAVIRRHREALKMSRSALGRIIERDPASIQAYEQGGKKVYGTWIVVSPTDPVLDALAGAFGTTAQTLLADAGLAEDAETAGAEAMDANAAAVRSANAGAGVVVSGAPEDISALLGLALERGLLGRLTFTPTT